METIIYLILEHKKTADILIREKAGAYRLFWIKFTEPPLALPQLEGRPRKLAFLECRRQERFQKKAEMYLQDWMNSLTGGVLERLLPYLGDSDNCYTVYDESVVRWLRKGGWEEVWKQYWPFPVFSGYREQFFVNELLKQGRLSHLVILGFEQYVPDLVTGHVRYLKSLRILIDYEPKQLEEFLEVLYEETGLTASCEVLPEADEDASPYRNLRLKCPVPSLILDFSGETRILTTDIARGSIWLDADAMEEKRRRMEERNTGIQYLSSKKLWKSAGFTLDTPIKNGYNTEVN